jgi:NAD(P)H-hydrate epimerase
MASELILSREQVRRVDRLAIERYGMSGLVLMENAGRGAVDVLVGREPGVVGEDPAVRFTSPPAPLHQGERSGMGAASSHQGERSRGSVVVICGKGNNAGDGFVIARHLEIRGVAVKAVLLFPVSELRGDALANYQILTHSDVQIVDVSAGPAVQLLDQHAVGAAWLIDAMLGTGAKGEPRPPLDGAIQWMNEQPARRLAVDLPSGLDCDTGVAASATVKADVTCTFVAMKPGFRRPEAQAFLGEVHVVDIGVPPRLVREAAEA